MNSIPTFRFIALLMALPLLFSLNVSADEAATTAEESSSLDSLNSARPLPCSSAVVLSEDDLADMDAEEFGDWIVPLPGFYPLDQAGFGQPFRGQFMSLAPWTIDLHFRGRKLEDHLIGSPELGWLPPGSLSRVTYNPFALDSPGARIDADLRILEPTPPSSRIATRDGFYGLGTVDFDLAQKVGPSLLLNGGGRVATFGGRLPHSEGYGLTLRAEIVWLDSVIAQADSSGLWGWWGIMQNRRNSQVPYSSVNHNGERYESDAVLNWKRHTFHGYGIQQRETYGGGDSDSWDEAGLIATTHLGHEDLGGEVSLKGATARWRLKSMDWATTAFGGANASGRWKALDYLNLDAYLGLELSDDFDAERHLGFAAKSGITPWSSLFAGVSQHQRQPTRFESAANYDPGEHYLPYDPVFYQNPELNVQGNPDLKNETYTRLFAGGQLRSSMLSGMLAYTQYSIEDKIAWQVQDGKIRAFNAPEEDLEGALGSCILKPHPRWQIGCTGSYLPVESGERRLFPEFMYHAWAQYQLKLFNDNLDMRFRVFEDFWGRRWLPVAGGWEKEKEVHVLSARIGARLYDVHVYYGVNNILDKHYDLLPGFPMIHREEVWGISWNFVN